MTDIFGSPEKVSRKDRLFEIALDALREQGWKVERVPRIGKSSVRRITKGRQSRQVSIRTSQDTWIAFPRNDQDSGWSTLCDVDVVLAVSVDSADDPKFAQVHMIEADEMRQRFDRAYAARKAAGYEIQLGRGVWLPLYHPDATDPVTHVGGGAGLEHPAIARVPLEPDELDPDATADRQGGGSNEQSLTIAEAKRRLAVSLGVDPSSIKITVEA